MDKNLKRFLLSTYAFSMALLSSCQHSQDQKDVIDETDDCHIPIPSYLLNQEKEFDDQDMEMELICDIQKPHLLRQDLKASKKNQSLVYSKNQIDFPLSDCVYFRYDLTDKKPCFSVIDNGSVVWDSRLLDETEKQTLTIDFDNFQKDLLELKSIKDEFQTYQTPLNQNQLRSNTLEWEYEMRYLVIQKRLSEFCALFYDFSFEKSELEQEDTSRSVKLEAQQHSLIKRSFTRQKD